MSYKHGKAKKQRYNYHTRKDNRHSNSYTGNMHQLKGTLKKHYNGLIRRKECYNGGYYKKIYDYWRTLY